MANVCPVRGDRDIVAGQIPTAVGGGDAVGSTSDMTVNQGEIRRDVLRIAWPSILENLLQSVLGVITIFMVSQLGSAEVAAVGASQQLQMLFISAFFALSMGATVIVAHAYGARQHDSIGVAAKQATLATIVLSSIIAIIVFVFAEPMLRWMGADSDVIAQGTRFQQISAIGYIFMALMFVLGGAMRGVGDTRTPMLVTLGINVINVAVAWPLIFGTLGMPELGLDGAAIAQNVSRFVGFVILAWILFRGKNGVSIAGREGWRPDVSFLRRLADISIPAMGESLLRGGGQILFVVVVFMLGTAVAAGHNIAQQAVFLSMFPGFGFSMAATALVGQSLGAGNAARAKAATLTATRACIVWMSAMGVFFFVFAVPIMEFSAPDGADRQQIIDAGVAALRVIAFAQPFQAIGFVLAGALRGGGDTRFPMFSTGIAMWVFRLPLAYVFAITFDLGLAGVYLAMAADNAILMVLNIWRYRQGKWTTSRLATRHDIEETTVPPPAVEAGVPPGTLTPKPETDAITANG